MECGTQAPAGALADASRGSYRAPAARIVSDGPRPRSRLGMVALLVGVGASLGLALLFGLVSYVAQTGSRIGWQQSSAIGLAALLCLVAYPLGLLLAAGAMFQPDRSKRYAWLALLLNGLGVVVILAQVFAARFF